MSDASQDFYQIICEICREDGIRIERFCDDWVAVLGKDGRQALIFCRDLGLNSSSAARIVDDKSALSQFLAHRSITNIEHRFFATPLRVWHSGEDDFAAIERLFASWGGDVVCKDNTGTSGNLVFRCTTVAELRLAVDSIFNKGCDLAVCPYVDIQNEYRLIMLDGKPELIFAKQARAGEWKNNLGFGATAIIENDPEICSQLTALASRACDALGLRFVSVDIANVNGNLYILEINAGVSINHFASQTPSNRQIAKSIYKKAIKLALS